MELTSLTVFSIPKASISAALADVNLNCGAGISSKHIVPPRLFMYAINCAACSRSSELADLKNPYSPGKAISLRSKW